MAETDAPLSKLRQICRSLPDTKETMTWGKPHFRVQDEIFCGYGDEDGVPVIGFKLEMDHARDIVRIPGFRRAPYVGHKGWVSMDASDVKDWDAVREMILESYRLIAPKKSLAKLDGTQATSATKKKKPRSLVTTARGKSATNSRIRRV